MDLYFHSGGYWRTSLSVGGRSVWKCQTRGVIFIMMVLVLCYVMLDCLTLSYVLLYCDYGKLLDTYFYKNSGCGLMMPLQTLVESIQNLQWLFKRSRPSAPLLQNPHAWGRTAAQCQTAIFEILVQLHKRGYKRTWLLFQRVCEASYTLYMSYHVGGSPEYTNIFLP